MLIRLLSAAGEGIYRHDAEGSDDMPVRLIPFPRLVCEDQWLLMTSGTHQVVTDRREREYTNIERQAGYGDMAGHMVSGVQEFEAEEEGYGYDTGGENVTGCWRGEGRDRVYDNMKL